MKPDELWEKYAKHTGSGRLMRLPEFTDALTEYGELVKAEAVKVCMEYDNNNHKNLVSLAMVDIEKMELP